MGVLNNMGLNGTIWLDGSFLTDKTDPADIDCLLVPTENSLIAAVQTHSATLNALIAQGEAKTLYGCDLYLCQTGNINQLSYWRGWFGFGRDGRTAKGIATLTL